MSALVVRVNFGGRGSAVDTVTFLFAGAVNGG